MAGNKRALEDSSARPKAKKSKVSEELQPVKEKRTKDKGKEKAKQPEQPVSSLIAEEVDFPRGGGTTLTPLEVKAIRVEGQKEADAELFKVCSI